LKTEKIVISSNVLAGITTEIMLDSNYISFKEIINFITTLRGLTLVLPKNTAFFIGSDHSNERGAIIKLE
jgi:hypothetical protein